MIANKESEHIILIMETFMRVSGRMTNIMVRGSKVLQTGAIMKVTG
jgi:hypothetical protein